MDIKLHEFLLKNNAACPQEKLQILKQYYASEVNSIRRLDNVKSLSSLLILLKKRGSLDKSKQNFIVKFLDLNYPPPKLVNGMNQTYNQPTICHLVSENTRQQMYTLITKEPEWFGTSKMFGLENGLLGGGVNQYVGEIRQMVGNILGISSSDIPQSSRLPCDANSNKKKKARRRHKKHNMVHI